MGDYFDVLLIDDDQSFAMDIKAYFATKGINVATLLDSTISFALGFEKFKIVLLDLNMPVHSGQEVLAKMPADRRPVVIIVSGHSDIETRIDLLEKGADFFLSKPVDLAELLLVCQRILGRHVVDLEHKTHWALNQSSLTLSSPTGAVFGLTASEFRILKLLFESSPNVVKKEELARAVTSRDGPSIVAFYRSLEVMISRMRIRFSSDDQPLPIRALRNVGYVFHGVGKIDD